MSDSVLFNLCISLKNLTIRINDKVVDCGLKLVQMLTHVYCEPFPITDHRNPNHPHIFVNFKEVTQLLAMRQSKHRISFQKRINLAPELVPYLFLYMIHIAPTT